MIAKRLFDVFASSLGLLLLVLVFIILAIAIKLDTSGPVFFRQERVGRFGKVFRIHKFRTMAVDSERKEIQITVRKDMRITRVGKILRRYKIDEFPQLIDVLLGSMSFVGPRPEVSRYVACYPEDVRRLVQTVRPGITDRASIEFKSESKIFSRDKNPDRAYIEDVLPIKLDYYMEYVRERSFLGDLKIIIQTLVTIVH